jgi:hypothetical protein
VAPRTAVATDELQVWSFPNLVVDFNLKVDGLSDRSLAATNEY